MLKVIALSMVTVVVLIIIAILISQINLHVTWPIVYEVRTF